jgi:hypothetical protein
MSFKQVIVHACEMDQRVRQSGIFYFEITSELQISMLAQVAMAWTTRSCLYWSILQRGCQRLFHANYMIRYTSGLVRDLKFNRHIFGTYCPLMMETIQECKPCMKSDNEGSRESQPETENLATTDVSNSLPLPLPPRSQGQPS